MKVSIITVVYNNEATIRSAINSVLSQDYDNIEYIVVDGASTDSTVDIIKSYGDKIDIFVSEKDKGLYDAMNKGLKLATGDVIGILNSDDMYNGPKSISKVVKAFKENDTDSVYADLVFVKPQKVDEVVRYYQAATFTLKKFKKGMMPPHPTFFVKREVYEKYGDFDTSFKISADYDLMLRFMYVHKIKYVHIPEVLVKMRSGGVSTNGIQSKITINQEILKSCRKNKVKTNMLRIYSKYITKVFQLVLRPKANVVEKTS